MKYFRNICITVSLLVFLSISFSVLAQVTDTSNTQQNTVEDKIEEATELLESEIDFTEYAETIEQLRKNPINLNTATLEQLRQIPFLNDILILRLQKHIQLNGKLFTVYELQSIDGFDVGIISSILPFVYVSNDVLKRKASFQEIMDNSKHQYLVRYSRVLQESKGYTPISQEELVNNQNARYLGSPDKFYMRYRFTYYNSLSAGITGEKDPGEEFFKGTMKSGFDFYSAHFWMKDLSIFKTLAIGDYNLTFGQGLGLWTGIGFGKSADIASMKKISKGITPYTSVEENKFLRGGAVSFELGKFEIFGFFSKKNRDASLLAVASDTLDSEEYYMSSLTSTGLHRTPSELSKKNVISETLYGGRVEYKSFRFNSGVTYYHQGFEQPLFRDIKQYNKYEFNGQSLFMTSIDYNYIFQNINLFGEAARSDNGGLAMLQGLYYTFGQNATISMLYRNYQKDYQSMYSGGFGEAGSTNNEKGLYAGMDIRLHPKWNLNTYLDMFRFPWMKYRVDAPSYGSDMLVQLTYRYSKTMSFNFRYRQKNKFLNSPAETIIKEILLTTRDSYRVQASYAVSPSVVLKTRIELSEYSYNTKKTEGFLFFQDVTINPKNKPWSLSCRYALFDTDSYDDRIYAYEDDVLYSYSIPAYYYNGSRFYVVAKYTVFRNLDVWLRYAQTYYSDQNVIGSGMDEIQGKIKSEIRAQVRLKF